MNQINEKSRRTFICIDLPDKVIKEIARIQEIVSEKRFVGKFTEAENLHLTLKFLGEISQETLEIVEEKLSLIKFPALNLKLSDIGTFSFKDSPRIVWIRITGNIFDLQKQIDLSLENLFPKEERFMSHLTIARIKYVKDKKAFIDCISKIKLNPVEFIVGSFKLKSSELMPVGPIYKTLKEFNKWA